jgi:hypothetical protein
MQTIGNPSLPLQPARIGKRIKVRTEPRRRTQSGIIDDARVKSQRTAEPTAAFRSILFESHDLNINRAPVEPAYFADLNLDQVIDAIVAGRDEYNLKPFFYLLPEDTGEITYRHEVMRDLENDKVRTCIDAFARQMREMRNYLQRVEKHYYPRQKQRWLLDAAAIYCAAVGGLATELAACGLKSRGFIAFRRYLAGYAASARFTTLMAEIKKLHRDLGSIRYLMQIGGSSVRVRKFDNEINYSDEVLSVFERFKQGEVKDHSSKFNDLVDMNHVEAAVLDLVAKLYPEIFAALDRFCEANGDFADQAITRFDREIQFYAAYLAFVAELRRVKLEFCYPLVTGGSKAISGSRVFDVALALSFTRDRTPIVCNDFYLKDKERIFVITGPNQGGKTTFARMFGQLHYLARLGCPVPGRKAQLFLFDQLFTHFERQEDISQLRGKLEDDLVRVRAILKQATPSSVVVMNEIFASTTLKDAVFLSSRIMKRLVRLDLLCVWVTFLDELASFAPQTVSVASTVVPGNTAERTFKIVRKPADGLAYALSIAQKYRLTYKQLKRRVKS